MALRSRTSNGTLASALRELLTSQAQLATSQAQLLANEARFMAQLDEDRQRFARIERDLDMIKALLIKHEELLKKLPEAIEMLTKLPEAIREKIGFKQ